MHGQLANILQSAVAWFFMLVNFITMSCEEGEDPVKFFEPYLLGKWNTPVHIYFYYFKLNNMCWILICNVNKQYACKTFSSFQWLLLVLFSTCRCCCCCCHCCRLVRCRIKLNIVSALLLLLLLFLYFFIAVSQQNGSTKVALICINCNNSRSCKSGAGGWRLSQARVDATNGQAIDMPMNHQSLQTDPSARPPPPPTSPEASLQLSVQSADMDSGKAAFTASWFTAILCLCQRAYTFCHLDSSGDYNRCL